ncbi:MAG: hypothetical protein J6A19_14610 [Oscillospiraceae bacterium]|nr:hypothetical protein [Oscillospiraceae bacterium]
MEINSKIFFDEYNMNYNIGNYVSTSQKICQIIKKIFGRYKNQSFLYVGKNQRIDYKADIAHLKAISLVPFRDYQYEYEIVLEKGFTFDGGYVVKAYYYLKSKQIWFVLNDINYEIRRNFTKKALDTWESFGGEIIPIVTSVSRFDKTTMPGGAIELKVGH